MQRKETDNWLNEVDGFNARMAELDVTPSISVSDKAGLAILAHARFSPFEAENEAPPFLMLTLCTAKVGRMHRSGEGPSLEGIIRPGTFTMALPNMSTFGAFPGTEMLGIAVNLSALNSLIEHAYTTEDFIPAASQLHNDVYLSSVMNALWRDAELHGLSSAFFEQGLNVILQHLSHTEYKPVSKKSVYSLSQRHLKTVLDYIESKVCSDVSVAELAKLVGQDTQSFTRSFSAATGYTPYVYFTLRRMEYAKRLICDGNLNITDVAVTIGYSNPSKFSAAFRRIVGVTPNTWRKQHIKQ